MFETTRLASTGKVGLEEHTSIFIYGDACVHVWMHALHVCMQHMSTKWLPPPRSVVIAVPMELHLSSGNECVAVRYFGALYSHLIIKPWVREKSTVCLEMFESHAAHLATARAGDAVPSQRWRCYVDRVWAIFRDQGIFMTVAGRLFIQFHRN